MLTAPFLCEVGMTSDLLSTAEAPFEGIKQQRPGRDGSRRGIAVFVEIIYLRFGGLA